MRKLLASVALALALGACGDNDRADTPTPTATVADPLEGYSEGVKKYYGTDVQPEAEEGSNEDVEAEYHQPPKPAEAGLGETITLTGSNIGVRLRVTVTGLKRESDYQAVELELESTGITNYEAPISSATLTYGDGEPQPLVEGATAPCSNELGFPSIYIPTGGKVSGCLLFEPSESGEPTRFQLALETVPVEAGGIWNLSPE